MPPEDRSNLPKLQPQQATQDVAGIDKSVDTGDDIFLVKPPEKEPLDKKGVGIVTALTVLGVIILLAVLVFALIGSANGLATDYRRLATEQIAKTKTPLKDLTPELVINKRNIDSAVDKIALSEQAQPSLESVLFVGEWSDYYKKTEKLQGEVTRYYKKTDSYIETLKTTLQFDASLQKIAEDEPALTATINPEDPLTIRSISGSYNTFAKNIEKIKVSTELAELKKEIVELYTRQSAMYLTYAKAVEAKDSTSIEKVKLEIAQSTAEVTVATEDQVYVEALTPTYKHLLATQQKLITDLTK